MTRAEELRAQGRAHTKATGHDVAEADTSGYHEVGLALVCSQCDWTMSAEWQRGQEGPATDYGD